MGVEDPVALESELVPVLALSLLFLSFSASVVPEVVASDDVPVLPVRLRSELELGVVELGVELGVELESEVLDFLSFSLSVVEGAVA